MELESNSKLQPSSSKAGIHQVNKTPFIQSGSEERGEKSSQWGRTPGLHGPKPLPPGARPEQTQGAGTRKGLHCSHSGTAGRDLCPPPSTEPGKKRALWPYWTEGLLASTLNNTHKEGPLFRSSPPFFNRRRCTMFITDVHARGVLRYETQPLF